MRFKLLYRIPSAMQDFQDLDFGVDKCTERGANWDMETGNEKSIFTGNFLD